MRDSVRQLSNEFPDWQALMDRKNKEIEEVKEDYLRRNAALDKRVAAAETTKAATADVIPKHFLLSLSSMSDYAASKLL